MLESCAYPSANQFSIVTTLPVFAIPIAKFSPLCVNESWLSVIPAPSTREPAAAAPTTAPVSVTPL